MGGESGTRGYEASSVGQVVGQRVQQAERPQLPDHLLPQLWGGRTSDGRRRPAECLPGLWPREAAGMFDCADNTCRLDHTQQAGWTKCRFSRHGHGWTMNCEWNMANVMGWHGTHELAFSGDTRTTPGGFSIF